MLLYNTRGPLEPLAYIVATPRAGDTSASSRPASGSFVPGGSGCQKCLHSPWRVGPFPPRLQSGSAPYLLLDQEKVLSQCDRVMLLPS